MTPEQKEIYTALKGIELNDKYIYDLENDIKVLDMQRAELQHLLDSRKAQTEKIHANYYRRLQELHDVRPETRIVIT